MSMQQTRRTGLAHRSHESSRWTLTVVLAVTALFSGLFGVLVVTAQADAPALSGSTASYTLAFGAGLPSGASTVVASFTDYDASSSFGVNINWGDGTSSSNFGFGSAAVVAAGTLGGGNLFNVEADHSYAVPGVYPVTVDICDEPDSLFILTSCADAADTSSNGGALFGVYTSSSPGILPLSGGTITVTDVAGTSSGFGIAEGAFPTAQTVATFADLDGSLPGELVATIDWGDGFCCPPSPDQTPGTVTATGPGTFTVTGTKPFPYPDEGTYPITVTLTDPTGTVPGLGSPLAPVVLSGGTATVTDAALTPGTPLTVGGTEGTATTYGPLGTFIDAGSAPFPCGGFPFPPCDFTATINWGDGGPTSAGDLSLTFCFCPPSSQPWIVSGSHNYSEAGTYPITITVNDDGGSIAVLTGTATILDAALTSDSGPGPVLSGLIEGNNSGPLNLGSFTDDNAAATASDFSATVCWNDLGTSPVNDCGVLPASSVVSNGPAGAFKVVTTHVFREEGSFAPAVKITDDDGKMIAALSNAPMINVADHALTVVRQPTLQIQKKNSFTKTVATFSDGTTGEPVSDYSAVICWFTYNCSTASGLNVTWTVGKITSNGAGGWTVTGTWKYAAAGAYNGSVSITDSGGAPTVIAPVQAKVK